MRPTDGVPTVSSWRDTAHTGWPQAGSAWPGQRPRVPGNTAHLRSGRRQGGGVGSKGERLQRCWAGGWEWAVNPTGLSAGQWSSCAGAHISTGPEELRVQRAERLAAEVPWGVPLAPPCPPESRLVPALCWESGCENGCVLVRVNPQIPGLLSTMCLWPQREKVPQGHRTV